MTPQANIMKGLPARRGSPGWLLPIRLGLGAVVLIFGIWCSTGVNNDVSPATGLGPRTGIQPASR